MRVKIFARYFAIAGLALAFATSAAAQTGTLVAGRTDAGATHNLRTDASGNLYILGSGSGGAVFGSTATGIAPSQAPVYTAGIDGGGLTRPFLLDAAGHQSVIGSSANGATDDGSNPLKAGGVYNATQPTLLTGQRGDLQLGSRGALSVSLFGNGTTSSPAVSSPGADNLAPNTTLYVTPQGPLIYNGTGTGGASRYDQIRTVNGVVAAGTGIQAAGGVGVFNSTLPTFTTGQFGLLQMTASGSLRSNVTGIGSTTKTGLASTTVFAGQDGQNSTAATVAPLGISPFVYNGATQDQMVSANAAAATTGTGLAGAGQLGFDGTNWQKTTVDGTGAQYVNTTGKVKSYSVSLGASPWSGGGVFAELQGSASKTIHIKRVSVVGLSTSSANSAVILSIASTASTGSKTAASPYAFDSTNGASTVGSASALFSGGTLGTLVANFGAGIIIYGTTTGSTTPLSYVYSSQNNEQDITLRGTGQFFDLQIAGAPAGAVLNAYIEWTEE